MKPNALHHPTRGLLHVGPRVHVEDYCELQTCSKECSVVVFDDCSFLDPILHRIESVSDDGQDQEECNDDNGNHDIAFQHLV